MKVSLLAALAFGSLWKSTEELSALSGLSYDDTIRGVRDLQKSGHKIAETYQDGRYMYCLGGRIKTA